MRAKPMLWGAAIAIALSSTAALANVVVVKSLGPSAKAYPPGKTFPASAKITLQGGDVVTVLGPSSAQTLPRARQLRCQPDQPCFRRRPAGPLRRAPCGRSRAQPQHLGHRRYPERKGLRHKSVQTAALATGHRRNRQRPDPVLRRAGPEAELGCRQGPRPVAGRGADQERAQYQIQWADSGDKSSLDVVTVNSVPADMVGDGSGAHRERMPEPARPAGR